MVHWFKLLLYLVKIKTINRHLKGQLLTDSKVILFIVVMVILDLTVATQK